jgi:uncharacterized membrane protein/uncharacterized protein (UPF0548 family)
LEDRLAALERLGPNFDTEPHDLSLERGWNRYYSEAMLGCEPPGQPWSDGAFARARTGIQNYEFSDPRIVTAHFDPRQPLEGRRMLLEIRVLGLRYLCGVVVGEVRSEDDEERTTFGFRYDTLEGHIERGSEWFVLTQCKRTGELRYRIEAFWRPGEFPNWWSQVGFRVLAPLYQRHWHHRAQHRLACLARYGDVRPPRPEHGRLVHQGPAVIFRADRVKPEQSRVAWRHRAQRAPPGSQEVSAAASDDRCRGGSAGTRSAALVAAAAAGVAAGLRSMSPVAMLSREWDAGAKRAAMQPGLAAGPATCAESPSMAADVVGSPAVARVLTLAAAGEWLADKLPRTPDRIAPLPLAGRLLTGSLCGAAISTGLGRSGLAGAAAGALAALASAHAGFRTRTALARRFRWPPAAVALAEDAVALGLARWAASALHRQSRKDRHK